MPNELRTEVEQVKQQEEVKRALAQTSTVKPEIAPAAETKDKLLLGTHVIIVLALAVIVGVITKLPSRLWHRTRFHRRRAQAKILDQLAIGRPLETVESALGQPHLIGRAYKREDEWIEERIYRLPGAWVRDADRGTRN